MNASKENAKKALEALAEINDCMDEETRTSISSKFIKVEEFLEAAIRKLPSEKAFAKDKKRKVKV